jgi:hypothetical protein
MIWIPKSAVASMISFQTFAHLPAPPSPVGFQNPTVQYELTQLL